MKNRLPHLENREGRVCFQCHQLLAQGMLFKPYRKNSKIWDTSNNCHNCPKIEKLDVTLHLCIQKMLMERQTA